MNDEDVARTIAAFEAELELQNPHLRRRFRRLQRSPVLKAALVAALLGLAVILLAVGLGAGSFVVWVSGLGALGLSVVVDEGYQWRMRRAR